MKRDDLGEPVFRTDPAMEVRDEFRFHVEMRTRELVEQGWSEEAARAEAVRRFGDIERVRAECTMLGRSRNRRARVRWWISEVVADVRYAMRQLRAAPGFALAAGLTLALGIGGTTAIFSVVDAVILRAAPFERPEEVVTVAEVWGDRVGLGDVSAGNFVDWQEGARSFATMAAMRWSNFNLSTEESPERELGLMVTHGYFDVFGVRPLHGRTFLPEEDVPGNAQVVVLSHGLWTQQFAADPSIVGREIRLNDDAYTVVGVMPPGFDPYASGERLWVPIAFTAERRRMHDEHYLTVAARLMPGVSIEQAQQEMDRIAAELRERYPQDNADRGARVIPVIDSILDDDVRTRLLILLAAVGLVLLIACGNVANLMLVRGAQRGRELSVRAAVGAGRSRLVRQLVTECLVLSLFAGLAGVALAVAGVRAFVSLAPPGVPRLTSAGVNFTALWFAVSAALVSGLLFGLVPAFRVARRDLFATLREGGRDAVAGSRDRLRGAFVALQIALTFTLLTGAGLLIRSATLLGAVDPGFEPEGVLSARITLPPVAYGEGEDARRTFATLVERLNTASAIEVASISSQVPGGPGSGSNGLLPEGRPFDHDQLIEARLRVVTPGYFSTLGIRLVQGRDFTAGDVAGGNRVMIISRRLAEQSWPGEDPIGRRIVCCEGSQDDPRWKTVIGVADNVQWRGPGQTHLPEFYLPLAQAPVEAFSWIQNTMTIVARSNPRDAAAVVDAMRTAARAVAPNVPLYDVRTMRDRMRATYATSRFNAQLLAVLGAFGLVISLIGIYGVVAYQASRRHHEIGLRMALGATARDVLSLVARQGLGPVLVGTVLGLAGAVAATRVLRSALFGVTPDDPVTFLAAGSLLLLAAILASLLPARRVARIDPGRVLTHT